MAKPKLALIPSAQGSKFYSVLPSSGVGDFDFSRSGSATRINSQGLIETVANGISRLNYPLIDGKVVGCPSHLLEPQRTNLVQYSEDFSQSSWVKASVTVDINSSISPDGTLNADKITKTSGGGGVIYSKSINGTYTVSSYIKADVSSWSLLYINFSGGTDGQVFFDLKNGVIGDEVAVDGFIENVGNGWYRCGATFTTPANLSDFRIFPSEPNSTTATSGSIYVWGAMLEQGSFPTSYIPNYGTALGVTRSAETANNSGDASTFNDSDGVLMVEGALLSELINDARISISDGSSVENRITFRYLDDNEFNAQIGFTNGFSETVTLNSIVDYNKIALVYNSTNASIFVNGFKVATNTMSALSGLSQLQFNRFGGSANDFYGNTKQIQYFDSVLNDSDLETLTSWVSFSDMANGQLYTIE
jgi:hypothetical protein